MKRFKDFMNLSEGNNDISKEKLKLVDWKGFEAHIKSLAGISVTIKPKLGNRGVTYESSNMIAKGGMFKSVMKAAHISNFNAGVVVSDGTFAIGAHISWVGKDGGTNGLEMFTAWYNFDKRTWVFRDK